ncbi:MAG: phosphoribosylpyrophosphate synthetase [Taibaiella sp.]|nr:phosphoribosylpyrophosphate synthetase [Taibaiella sp.]
MDTLSEILNKLRKEGYTVDFNLKQSYLGNHDDSYKLMHDEFVIDKVYRFEGMSDPDDEATVYAISSPRYNIKGVLVNGAGIYTDDVANEMLEALRIVKR